jgi:hypothetical protein
VNAPEHSRRKGYLIAVVTEPPKQLVDTLALDIGRMVRGQGAPNFLHEMPAQAV